MNKCLVVMQPTFLPWSGYFNLIAQADDFVFLNDVQLEKQSWQTRNRLIISGHMQWVSVPVRHQHFSQTIVETEVIDSSRWRAKLARGFDLNYRHHPYYKDAYLIIEYLLHQATVSLGDLNELVIRFIASNLKLNARLHRASEIKVTGVRSERLISFCHQFGSKKYLSPIGAAQYLEADGFSQRAPVDLRFQSYAPLSYPQKKLQAFQSHLSILDVIANIGWDLTCDYVRKGYI